MRKRTAAPAEPPPDDTEVAATLDIMLTGELIALEHLEPLAARLDLSAADTLFAKDQARLRIRALDAAHKRFHGAVTKR